LLNEAIANLRGYIGNLQPQGMGESLEAVIRNQTEDARLNSLVEIQVEMDKLPEEPFNAARLPHVAAILTEALSNAARHSGSRSVKVSAACEDGQCVLSVEDDGRGFDSAAPKPGYGLRNMRDRARLLAGSLDVVTQPGKGTRITLRIPWREEA
jgi:signal transduction histidine kinase